jgi:hypothetical protein
MYLISLALHSVTSALNILSSAAMSGGSKKLSSCPQTRFLNWFGTVKVKTQQPQVIARRRKREVSKTRGVTPTTGPPNIQWSSVQQFDFDKCL